MRKNLRKLLFTAFCFFLFGACSNKGIPANSDAEKSDDSLKEEDDYGITVHDIEAYAAPLRPSYHYSAQNSWLNDPNGLVYFNGIWHMYYQTNPGSNVNGNMHWGHAVSDDLIHWSEKDIALYPYPDGTGYMWSGTAYADDENRSGLFDETGSGIIAAFSTDTQQIGLAYSTDGYKYKKLGIVIPNPGVKDFRDPKLFWHEESGKWIMVVAGGEVSIYSSVDLKKWTPESKTGIFTECPDLFKIKIKGTDSEKWILTCGSRGYYIGSFDGSKFVPESEYITMNEGPDFYAGIIFNNAPDDRVIMIAWMNNWAYTMPPDGIWNGNMSLPVELVLENIDGIGLRLKQKPVAEAASLDWNTLIESNNVFLSSGNDALSGVLSSSFCLKLSIDMTMTEDFRLEICKSEKESVILQFDKKSRTFCFDRTGLQNIIPDMKAAGIYEFSLSEKDAADDSFDICIYVDKSTFEMYAGEGLYTFSARIQPDTSSKGMSMTSESGCLINHIEVKTLKSIWFGEYIPEQ